MTAENAGRPSRPRRSAPCFNEAAADDRGKLWHLGSPPGGGSTRFNEAAADDRGKHRPRRPDEGDRAPLQ